MVFSRRLAGRQGGLGKAAVVGGTGRRRRQQLHHPLRCQSQLLGSPNRSNRPGLGKPVIVAMPSLATVKIMIP
ncbi:MAG: hypothetical protein K0S88_1421 [Actinomycetia bacterium]|jgi:hypothetical protein|nr:hypothetical protein [Actinomycetes bacterium]